MTPRVATIRIHPPLCPPPADRNYKLITPPDGHQFWVVWPLGKTLGEAAAPFLVGLYELVYGQK